jgi:adenosylcobinamide-GDP ribazoletransferase
VTTALGQQPMQLAADDPQRKPVRAALVAFMAAMQFLTIMPPLVRRPFSPLELGRAVGWFPVVGILLGGFLVGVNLAIGMIFPPAVVAALLLAVWVLVTGALHLDGFLDSCDGLFGGSTPEARLRIMRDERAGAFAVIGGTLLILVKYACLVSLADRTVALLLAPTLGRWAMAVCVIAFPYARPQGLGRALKDHAGLRQLTIATLVTVVGAAVAGPWLGMIAFAAAGIVLVATAAIAVGRLGGLTGDIYGAICEVVETVTLLVFVAGETP